MRQGRGGAIMCRLWAMGLDAAGELREMAEDAAQELYTSQGARGLGY